MGTAGRALILAVGWVAGACAQATLPYRAEIRTPEARCAAVTPETICFQFTKSPAGGGFAGPGSALIRLSGPSEGEGSIETRVLSPDGEEWLQVIRSGSVADNPSNFGDLPLDFLLTIDQFRVAQFHAGRFMASLVVTFDGGPTVKLPIQLTVGPDSDSIRAVPDFVPHFSFAPDPAADFVDTTVRMTANGAGPRPGAITVSTETSDDGNWMSVNMHWFAVGCAEYPLPCSLFARLKPPTTPGDYWGVWAVHGGGYGDRIVVRFRVLAPLKAGPLILDPQAVSMSAQLGTTALVSRLVSVSGGGNDGVTFTATRTNTWLTVEPATAEWPATLRLSFNPTGLEAGTYTDVVILRPEVGREPLGSIPVTFNIVSPSYAPAVLDGGGWRTSFYLVNPSVAEARSSLRFWASSGTSGSTEKASPWLLDVAGRGLVSGVENERVPPLGVRVIETQGAQSKSQQGWVDLESDGPVAMHVVLTETKAGAPAKLPPADATIPLMNPFLDALLLPFDNAAAVSSIALANPSDEPVTVEPVILSESGVELAREAKFTLAAKGTVTLVLGEKWPVAAQRRGSLALNFKGGRLLAVGLRSLGRSFHAYPAVARGRIGVDRGITPVAAGGAWQSIVQLTNSSAVGQNRPVQLWPDKSRGASEGLEGELSLLAPANGLLTWTPEAKDPTRTQWGWFESRHTPQVTGYAFLRKSVTLAAGAAPASEVFESSYGAQKGTSGRLAIPFDNRGGSVTRVMLVNAGDQPTEIQPVVYDPSGRFPRFLDPFRLPGRGQLAVNSATQWELEGQQGVIEFSSRVSNKLSGVGLRFGDAQVAILPGYEK